MRAHDGQAAAACYLCSAEFNLWSNLRKHMIKYHNDSILKCGCGKTFIHKSGYDQHKCSLSEKQVFICEICGKNFDDRHKFNVSQYDTIHEHDYFNIFFHNLESFSCSQEWYSVRV